MLWFLLISPIAVLAVHYFINVYLFNKKLARFPSPPGIFLLGQSLHFLNPPKGGLLTLYDFMLKYGYTLTIQTGPERTMLITSDYDLVEFILPHPKLLKKTPEYEFLRPWLGMGLLTSDGGPKWKKHRKILTPAFHFKILENYISTFHSSGEILVKKLETQVGKKSVNIVPFISLYNLDVICETAMGTSVNAQNGGESDYVRSVKELCRIFEGRTFSPWKRSDFLFKFSTDYQLQLKALKIVHGYADTVIKTKLGNMEHTNDKTLVDDVGTKRKRSFLDLLLSEMETQNLSLTDIRDEVDTFMFAGQDTTSVTICFLIHNLSAHPDIQEKVFQEQKEIFKDDLSRPVESEDLREMKYLELVIKESLRYHPTVPFFARQLTEDVLYDGQILPKGLSVSVFTYGLHRNPKFFPDPEKFDPSRFENNHGDRPYAFVPFSSGPRNCLGQKFAMLSIKSIISKLVRRFEFLPTDPPHVPELESETVLVSKNGIEVQIKNR